MLTRHIEFEPGAGTFELAVLAVTASDPCTVARALATEMGPQLPR